MSEQVKCHHTAAHYSAEHDNYYCDQCHAGMGNAYYEAARKRDALIAENAQLRERVKELEKRVKSDSEYIQTVSVSLSESIGTEAEVHKTRRQLAEANAREAVHPDISDTTALDAYLAEQVKPTVKLLDKATDVLASYEHRLAQQTADEADRLRNIGGVEK
jgi:hypothetical protein